MPTIKLDAIQMRQKHRNFYLCRMRASQLSKISYAAIRGESDESGAVQRVLNSRRIERLKTFALRQADYPGSVVLNWTHPNKKLLYSKSKLTVALDEHSAQIIDGQHRIAGLRAAIEDQTDVGNLEIPVSIYDGLDTEACADIFLSINTEQKPVPRSLVFDLYGIAGDYEIDPAAARARDIAVSLNEVEGSPYESMIKFPRSAKVKGGIALSSAVSALKALVEDKGAFELIGIGSLELQTQVVLNFFNALKSKYGAEDWFSLKNAFMFAGGFTGAVDFLRVNVLPYCHAHDKNFTESFIANALSLPAGELIWQEEIRGVQGKAAPKKIHERLKESFAIGSYEAGDNIKV